MGLTPLDITNKEFPKKLRGYDTDAVDEFLDQIIREFELLIRENGHLKEQIEHLEKKLEQYRHLEDTINRTLVVAQESAEELKNNAKREADLVIQEARIQAERIIQAGQAKATKIMEENADLSRAVQVLRNQVRNMLVAQLQAIDGLHDPFVRVAAAELTPELGPGRPQKISE